MKNNSSSYHILWVGEKALEVFQRTMNDELNHIENHLLLYNENASPEKGNVYILLNQQQKKQIDYNSSSLKGPIREYLSDQQLPHFDLLVGSSFELLVQEVVKNYQDQGTTATKPTEKVELFSDTLYRRTSESQTKQQTPILFLQQNIPFKDMKEESVATISFAKEHFENVYSTIHSESSVRNFIERMMEHSIEIKECKEVLEL